MKFEYMGETYHIKFFHETFNETYRNKPLPVRYTDCKILEGERSREAHLLLLGSARCSPKDNFSKDKGRRFSLKDALSTVGNDMSSDKEFRAAAWKAYFER